MLTNSYYDLPCCAMLCHAVPCCAMLCHATLCVSVGEENKELWKAHDATELVKSYSGPALPTLVDTGSADNFLEREVRQTTGSTSFVDWLVDWFEAGLLLPCLLLPLFLATSRAALSLRAASHQCADFLGCIWDSAGDTACGLHMAAVFTVVPCS